ncbi:beta-ketoacyl-ACP synthase [Spirulina subsalsa FACHB-351]|uniref:Beta-ketoacyl-ACP synthase n=1 Tax=Spirulina subsalsa FACHB-351 TaxID=234711 RepID=A0ABT3L8A1_9CYAN|nr:beta-ketoacyl-ACP synthase [Spirulina subsalsa]MCW6037728.1 beta-ketoacyl-ACP synthase [Spirulina subsalsa FACHB-351]
MKVVVTGISLWSALGNLEQSWQALQQHQSAIRLQQPFVELPALPLATIGNTPLQLPDLLSPLLKDVLADSGLEPPLTDCGVVVGSSRSFQGLWEQWAQRDYLAAQWEATAFTPWLDTLPHQVALTLARSVGSQGAVLAPMAACATGIWAIARGYELIRTGEYERVLVGAVEAPITPLTLAGFAKMGALATTGCYPFDQHREGLVLGEGGALLLLESAELAQQRQKTPYGEILGFGVTADGYHVSAPNPLGSSAMRAIENCLQSSHLRPEDVDYIHSHGTSTPLNDQNEAQIMTALFPPAVWVSSTKGATGHTLGASGALGVVFSLLALREQILPPCVGLRESAFALNFVNKCQSFPLNYALCLSFGFGGQNGAIALGRAC